MRLNRKVLVRGPIVPAAVDASFLLIIGTSCSAGKAGATLLTGPTEPAASFGSPDPGGTYKFVWNYLVDGKRRVYLWDAYGPDHIDVYDAAGRFRPIHCRHLRQGIRPQGPRLLLQFRKGQYGRDH